MFGSVALSTHSIDDYAPIVGNDAIAELRRLAEPLRGLRLLALSSPGASDAVRSLLQSSIPLFNDLGMQAHWQQVRVSSEYLDMDRTIRRALSGTPVQWPANIEAEWREFNLGNARLFDEEFDIVVVHHTASVGLLGALNQLQGKRPAGAWLWDSHRDYRGALPEAWSMFRPHADAFDAAIYDYKPFIRMDSPTERPDVQLLGINMLTDGEDLTGTLNNLRQRGNDVGDVIVLTEMDRVGNVELSALRDNATVLIHQGMPRGISIELLEEMWQARPIVSGRSPVAEAVLSRPRVGVLADTAPEQAHSIVRLLNRPAEAARIGAAAKARVASHHLITRHVAGYLKLFQQVSRKRAKNRNS